MSVVRQIARNAGGMALAQAITLLAGLVLTAYLARTLGPSAYGVLRFGLALLSYAAVLVQLGFRTLGTRELARDPSRREWLVTHVLSIRLVLFGLGLVLYLGCVAALPKPSGFKLVVAALGIALFGHALSIDWVYQGLQRMGFVALQQAVTTGVTLLGTILLVRSYSDLLTAAFVMAGGLVAGPAALLVAYARSYGPIRIRYDRDAWVSLIRPALPLAASAFMIALYYNMDQIMLGLLRTEGEVGLYAAGYRVVTAALAPAMVVYTAFLPTLSSALGDLAQMRNRARMHGRVQLALGLPISVGGFLLAPQLIVLLGGPEFAAGTAALRLLMLNVAIVYLNMVLGQPLPAWDLQRRHMYAIAGGACSNVVLNVVLIPPLGIEGAALATVSSEFIVLLGLGYLHYKAVATIHLSLLTRPAFATLLGVALPCGLGLYYGLPLAGTMAAVALAYPLAAWATGTVTVDDLRRLRASRAPAEQRKT